jgi:polyisoprenoid-binding protein YceI
MRMGWVFQAAVLMALGACSAGGPANEPARATEAPQAEVQGATAAPADSAGAPEGGVVFQIQPAETEARFVIGEILGGQPNTVIGVNNQVQGRITLDFSDPAASQIGAIVIGADAFVTDSSLRNRAINQFILQSGANPLITFVPASISGLPGAAAVGQPVQLEISGDLTIRDITQPVTFTAEVVLAAENRLEGSATATIQRAEFELTIPQVPRVAGVDEAVVLELDFVALAP